MSGTYRPPVSGLVPVLLLFLSPTLAAGPPSPPNLLIVTLDTTRADHLSCYGYPHPTSPNIDRIARGGVLFESATTQIPLTGPAHASLMTSRHPRSHGAVRNGVPMRADVPTLAEVLRGHGYATGAFVSGWTLRRNLTGLDRGFDRFDDRLEDRYRVVNAQRTADQATDLALQWIGERKGRPFFLWVHYFDPHSPYRRHPEFYRLPAGGSSGRNEFGYPLEKVARYDSEIGFTDREIGRLLGAVDRSGTGPDTLVVITGDHGESFGDHGYVGHGRRVYEANLHVPLIVRFPRNLPGGGRSSHPAQTIDVMPTVLALLGVPGPMGMEGRDLGPALRGTTDLPEPEIYFETFAGARKKFWRVFSPPLAGVPIRVGRRIGAWKYIYDPKTGEHELYDLATDPAETINRIRDHPEFLGLGRHCLDRHGNHGLRADQALSQEDRRTLKSLGYLE
ncbi:MAG: sulfatase [Acidobacteria bacterium]|nr:sulfatase [Acidobacteriota bacterium]